jgi:hypothetical protein
MVNYFVCDKIWIIEIDINKKRNKKTIMINVVKIIIKFCNQHLKSIKDLLKN